MHPSVPAAEQVTHPGRRILVTGSRAWADIEKIAEVLGEFCEHGEASGTLVSGACPDGADAMAEEVWESLGGYVERHPADWKRHGKRAGFVRNAEMVALGADVCLAFIKEGSKGATMTADLAQQSGMLVVRYET